MEVLSRQRNGFFANAEVWHVRSAYVRDVLRVCICGPEGPIHQSSRVGVVYALDAPWLAGALANLIASCSLSGELPSLYAVSIGYPLDRRPGHSLQRVRDLTPTSHPPFDRVLPLMLGTTGTVASGGADAFLAFLLEELRPALAAEFLIDPRLGTLVGTSLGGLFTLYALLSYPQAFARYLPISPSIWWDDRFILRLAAERCTAATAPAASVYLCAGELDGNERVREQLAALPENIRILVPRDMAGASIPDDTRMMVQVLSTWSVNGFRVVGDIIPQESHNSVSGAALSRGLRALYGTLPWTGTS